MILVMFIVIVLKSYKKSEFKNEVNITREKLINYINHNLECWCEAFFKLLIKILLLTIYLTIMVVIFNKEYICEEEEEKSNNNNHWN